MITVRLDRCVDSEELSQRLDWIFTGMGDSKKVAHVKEDLLEMVASSKSTKVHEIHARLWDGMKQLFQANRDLIDTSTFATLLKWREVQPRPSESRIQRLIRKVLRRSEEEPLIARALKFLREDMGGDVVFLLASGERIRAHFGVLSQIPFFSHSIARINGRGEEPISPHYPLEISLSSLPVTRETLDAFLDCQYASILPNPSKLKPLFYFADYLRDEALMGEILESQLRAENYPVFFDLLLSQGHSFQFLPLEEEFFGRVFIEWWGFEKETLNKSAIAMLTEYAKEHPLAQILLAFVYFRGKKGVARDPAKTFELFQLAANQGHPLGQAYLGLCYEHAVGVVEDLVRASELYRLSAEQGHPLGEAFLGFFFLRGIAVGQDAHRAFELFTLSADKGHPLGIIYLAECHLMGMGPVAWGEEREEQCHAILKRCKWGRDYYDLWDRFFSTSMLPNTIRNKNLNP